MAIFTEENWKVTKHIEDFEATIDAMTKEQVEEKFKKYLSYFDNYSELSYDEKKKLIIGDFQKCIEVIVDRYQDYETCEMTASIETVEKALEPVLVPFVNGDLFYYSEQLQDYNEIKFLHNEDIKFPKDVVSELEKRGN